MVYLVKGNYSYDDPNILKNEFCHVPIWKPSKTTRAEIPRAFRQRFYSANINSAIMPVTP